MFKKGTRLSNSELSRMSLLKNVVVDIIKKIANVLNNRPLTVDYYDELIQP